MLLSNVSRLAYTHRPSLACRPVHPAVSSHHGSVISTRPISAARPLTTPLRRLASPAATSPASSGLQTAGGSDLASLPNAAPLQRHSWLWKDASGAEHKISYSSAGCGQPILFIHGFGASAGHYRKNMAELSKNYKVYAIDLLGFGNSAKPALAYSTELWRDQVLAFQKEFISAPVVLVGNSIGSLVCLMVNAAAAEGTVRGTVLLNSAGAMNNKGVTGDWRIVLAMPIFLFIDFLLSIAPVARYLFDSFRKKETLRKVLLTVYRNAEAVDEALIELLHGPSEDPGALAVFTSVLSGPPGPSPWSLMSAVKAPMLILWGDKDTLTPADGPVGKYFKDLAREDSATRRPDTSFTFLADTGHCPHDDRPELVHALLWPWLRMLDQQATAVTPAKPLLEGAPASL